MALSDHYNLTIKIYSPINVGTNIKPLWSWALIDTVKGMRDELSTRERLYRDNLVSEWDYMVIMDVPTIDIDSSYRFVIGTEAFNIDPPQNPNDLNHHLEIKVKKLDVSQYNETVSGDSSS